MSGPGGKGGCGGGRIPQGYESRIDHFFSFHGMKDMKLCYLSADIRSEPHHMIAKVGPLSTVLNLSGEGRQGEGSRQPAALEQRRRWRKRLVGSVRWAAARPRTWVQGVGTALQSDTKMPGDENHPGIEGKSPVSH